MNTYIWPWYINDWRGLPCEYIIDDQKMTDEIITDFDMPADVESGERDVVQELIEAWHRIRKGAEEQVARYSDPDWELRSTHLMSRELAEMLEHPETPEDKKAYILGSTYIGTYWYHKDDKTKPCHPY